MIEKETVFIIGAGSGVPYNFPTGDKFRIDIINNFNRLYNKHVQPYAMSHSLDSRLIISPPRIVEFIDHFKKSGIQIDLRRCNFPAGPCYTKV